MEKILRTIEKIIPKKIYKFGQPFYHYSLAVLSNIIFLNPSKDIFIIGITGTKGKSSTAEFVNTILETAGKKTAILSTIRFKVGNSDKPNKYKMTMPGRFFTQSFLRRAVNDGCEYAIIEMTSEGARFFRHIGVQMNALIFTNLKPEHIESHGSFKKYKDAKLRLIKQLAKNKKQQTIALANVDDEHGTSFLVADVNKNISYSLKDVGIIKSDDKSSDIVWDGMKIHIPLPGKFNILNALSAMKLAKELNISNETIKEGIEKLKIIRGRVENVNEGGDFDVIIDYAHTDDSLKKLYETFKGKRIIGVLGSCGGGRDKWKRPLMGSIADEYCDEIILTNEDPYDEDPMQIIKDVEEGIKNHKAKIILDRREAIREAIKEAKKGDVILITGKGTDPYIMEANGKKTEWDDATVAREEIQKQSANSK